MFHIFSFVASFVPLIFISSLFPVPCMNTHTPFDPKRVIYIFLMILEEGKNIIFYRILIQIPQKGSEKGRMSFRGSILRPSFRILLFLRPIRMDEYRKQRVQGQVRKNGILILPLFPPGFRKRLIYLWSFIP